MEEAAPLASYWLVAFSGSRHLSDPAQVRLRIREALTELIGIADGQLVAVSSAAIGSDLLFVQEAFGLKIPWIAVLPFPEDYFFNGKDFPEPADREPAKQILKQAADCDVMRIPTDSAQAEESNWRHSAFAEAGLHGVDQSDVLIAVIDEKSLSGKPGGTGEVLKHARSLGRPIIAIDPNSGTMKRENWPRRLEDPLTIELRSLGNAPVKPAEAAILPTDSARLVAAWRNGIARVARRHVPGIRWVNTGVVVLHTIAMIITALVLLLLSGLSRYSRGILESVSFVFVLTGFLCLTWLLRSKPHTRGANYRFVAEIGRSFLAAWKVAGAPPRLMRVPPKDFRHFVRSLTLQYRLDPDRQKDTAALSEEEVERLGDDYIQNRVNQQLETYYRPKHERAHRMAIRLEIFTMILSGLALLSAGFLLFGRVEGVTEHAWGWIKLTAAALAPLGLSLLVIHEIRRREARYREMDLILQEYGRQISQTKTLSKLRDLVVETEQMFLGETYEWWILAKENVAA